MGFRAYGSRFGRKLSSLCTLVNGDFATGDFSGWYYVRNTTISTSDPENGTYHAHSDIDPWDEYTSMYQRFYCNPAGYTFGFWYKMSDKARMVVTLYTANWNWSYDNSSAPYNAWRHVEVVVPGTAIYGQVRISYRPTCQSPGDTGIVKSDNFTFIK